MKTPLLVILFLTFTSGVVVRGAPSGAQPQVEVSRSVYLMGTDASLRTYARDREFGLARLEGFLMILEAAELELSSWIERSEISRLNRQPLGAPFLLNRNLCRLFVALRFWSDRTEGAFEPAAGRLIEAWGIQSGGRAPSPEELERARRNTGIEHLRLDGDACVVVRDRPALIDAGAFGKGEALDRVRNYAVRTGGDGWLIDLGGQIMVHGSPPDSEFWQVDLAHPLYRDQPVMTIELKGGSIATSGGSQRDLGTGPNRIGHILDPRTGSSLVTDVSVTVWHSGGLEADVLSTALYVMGVEDGLAWASANGVAAAFLVPQIEGSVTVLVSPLFRETFLTN